MESQEARRASRHLQRAHELLNPQGFGYGGASVVSGKTPNLQQRQQARELLSGNFLGFGGPKKKRKEKNAGMSLKFKCDTHECTLVTRECKQAGCGELVTLGMPYCPVHTAQKYGVRYDVSKIKNAGCGLFSTRAFEKGENICAYGGEEIDIHELNRRYPGDALGPYVVVYSSWQNRYDERRRLLDLSKSKLQARKFNVRVREGYENKEEEPKDAHVHDRSASLTCITRNDNTSLDQIAKALKIDPQKLLQWNKQIYPDIRNSSRLKKSTHVWLEEPYDEPDVISDGACCRGIGSMANSHEDAGRCNSSMILHGNEIWLQATKRIEAGDEILNDYGNGYWGGGRLTHSTYIEDIEDMERSEYRPVNTNMACIIAMGGKHHRRKKMGFSVLK